MWVWNCGSPIDLILGGNGERPGTGISIIRLGQSIEEGERPQGLVPGGVWQMAKPVRGDVLVTCIVAPGFDYQDFTLLEEQ
ncbi:hypothetical protein FBU30_009041 [Linnemannia zychae]|nr:hypothetical protein FBU30_009041 [Linnemannia zychae]